MGTEPMVLSRVLQRWALRVFTVSYRDDYPNFPSCLDIDSPLRFEERCPTSTDSHYRTGDSLLPSASDNLHCHGSEIDKGGSYGRAGRVRTRCSEEAKRRSAKAGLPPGTLVYIGSRKTDHVRLTLINIATASSTFRAQQRRRVPGDLYRH
jgi:hypothetical protein